MSDELNIPTHRWYQTRNNIRLPKQDFSRDWIYDSGIQKIDAWINSQPWGNPVPALFEAGEQGAWYDPSDLTTMFQDTAGTNPVTATGQSVARINDKSGRGNNATQATTAAQPIYGIEPFGGRRNRMLWTEDLTNAAWLNTNVTVAAPDAQGWIRLQATTTANTNFYQTVVGAGSASGNTFTVQVKKGSGATDANRFFFRNDTTATTLISVQINYDTGAVSGTPGASDVTVTAGANAGEWTLKFTPSSGISAGDALRFYPVFAGASETAGEFVFLRNMQLEAGTVSTNYQRVTDQYNVTEAGVPSVSYLFFDGGDSLATPSVNFTATDKMTVFAGVRKLANAVGTIVELGAASGNGLAAVYGNSSNNYGVLSKGTLQATVVSPSGGTTPPITNIVTGIGDISGDITTIRINGAQAATSSTDQGTGNYGNFPLYLGARGGSTLFFSGNLYSLVVRGAQSSAGQISNTEIWVASKTGVTI
jgi:hypothetical protein